MGLMARGIGNGDVGAVLPQIVKIYNVFASWCHAVLSRHSTRPRPLVAVAAVHYPGSVYRCRASRGQSTVKCSALL